MDENMQLTDSFILDTLDSAIGSSLFSKARSAKCEIITDIDPDTLAPVIEINTEDNDILVTITTRVVMSNEDVIDSYVFEAVVNTPSIEEYASDDLAFKFNRWKEIVDIATEISNIEFDPYAYVD